MVVNATSIRHWTSYPGWLWSISITIWEHSALLLNSMFFAMSYHAMNDEKWACHSCLDQYKVSASSLLWRHYGRDGVSNHHRSRRYGLRCHAPMVIHIPCFIYNGTSLYRSKDLTTVVSFNGNHVSGSMASLYWDTTRCLEYVAVIQTWICASQSTILSIITSTSPVQLLPKYWSVKFT